ncbi:MAG: DUF2750 domain-containing protein [Hellea sp.]
MHPEKLKNFANMPPRDRAEYFIRRASDFEEIWGISVGDDNWIIESIYESKIFYVWPEREFAEEFMPENHRQASAKPQCIDLYDFINHYIPKLSDQDVMVSVFYGADDKSWVYLPADIKEVLEEELKQYM